ncbi:hypothetical protein CVS40_7154 [Lucilia cuprina]|nr:hypothetical protein CVS40_7154 [Lucilia cuprina]
MPLHRSRLMVAVNIRAQHAECCGHNGSQRSKYLLGLQRPQLSRLISIITGHCKFGNMPGALVSRSTNYCRSCQNEDEEETITHLLCDCPALAEARFQTLGSNYFGDLTELSNIKLERLLEFINLSNWV